MALWLVRAGKYGERESEAFDMGIATVGWNKIGTHTSGCGLLVSWGGFTAAVRREAEAHHFCVRLWYQSDLLDAFLQQYDRLPASLCVELPLMQAWTLVETSEV